MVGRLPVLAVIALFSVGGFAGCLGDGKGGARVDDEGDGGGGANADPVFSQSTGAVTGYVLDVSFAPIAGAQVSLVELGLNVTTDETGAYAVSEIEPGSYTLLANRTGFRPKAKPVSIAAGQLLREQFLLDQLPQVEPFIDQREPFKGYLECSMGSTGRCLATGAQGSDNHRPSGKYPVKAGLQALLVELTWSPTQGIGANDDGKGGFGGGMAMSLAWDSPNGDGSATTNGVNGQTLLIYLERQLVDGNYRIVCVEGCSGAAAQGSRPDWPFLADGQIAFSGSPNSPNVMAQRPFTIYVTGFFHMMRPPGFTAVPE